MKNTKYDTMGMKKNMGLGWIFDTDIGEA